MMAWFKNLFFPHVLTKEQFGAIWAESAVVMALGEVVSRHELTVEDYFTKRVDFSASKCQQKFGLSKSRFIEYLKQYERISDKEFNELFRGR